MATRQRRLAVAAPALLLAALGSASCESLPTEPRLRPTNSAVRCELPASLLIGVHPQPIASDGLRAALRHAAGPLASSFGWSEEVKQLVAALEDLAGTGRTQTPDAECRLLVAATEALAAVPGDPETLPDRDGIRLILILAAKTTQGD